MRRYIGILAFAALLSTGMLGDPWLSNIAISEEKSPTASVVRINGSVLTTEQIQELEAFYGVTPVPGDYWYDAMSGLYGIMGYQAAGMMMPGHPFGELRSNASNGDTGVFMNGRELTLLEVNYIQMLLGTQTLPGRYWLDAFGNCGIEGYPIPLVNFYTVSQNLTGGGGDNFWSTHFSAGNYDRGNLRGYVSVPGHGPIGYGY